MSKEDKETHTFKDFIRDHKLAIGIGCGVSFGVIAVFSALVYYYIRGAADAMNTFCEFPGGKNLMAMLSQGIDDPRMGKILDRANQVEYLGARNGDGVAIMYNTNNIERVAKAIRSGAVSNTDLAQLAEAILDGLKN